MGLSGAQWGYAVELAGGGPTALALSEQEAFGLVILDRGLPGCDGLDVCRRLRQGRGPQPLILMLSAWDSSADKVTGLAEEADDDVVKPFDPDVLRARVRALLRRSNRPLTTELSWGSVRLTPGDAPRSGGSGARAHPQGGAAAGSPAAGRRPERSTGAWPPIGRRTCAIGWSSWRSGPAPPLAPLRPARSARGSAQPLGRRRRRGEAAAARAGGAGADGGAGAGAAGAAGAAVHQPAGQCPAHHPPPGGVVRRAESLQGTTVRAEVVDQGPGIPVGQQQQVFERFWQGVGTAGALAPIPASTSTGADRPGPSAGA